MTDRNRRDDNVETPHARKVPPKNGKVDQLSDRGRQAEDRQEELIDEAVEESFPASDPPSPKHIT